MYDLVVYGATGFTGKLLTRYIARQVPATFRWAIAGRSTTRLEAVKSDAGASGADILIADSKDDASVFDMVGKTKVVRSVQWLCTPLLCCGHMLTLLFRTVCSLLPAAIRKPK